MSAPRTNTRIIKFTTDETPSRDLDLHFQAWRIVGVSQPKGTREKVRPTPTGFVRRTIAPEPASFEVRFLYAPGLIARAVGKNWYDQLEHFKSFINSRGTLTFGGVTHGLYDLASVDWEAADPSYLYSDEGAAPRLVEVTARWREGVQGQGVTYTVPSRTTNGGGGGNGNVTPG